MFALVDCNNFYASCERVFNPSLNGIPVVILSNNDGCVIARSNEAKAIGIKMGAPAFQLDELFKQNNVAVFSSNYALYGDMSQRVMNTLAGFSPDFEIYSIDEAFLNLEGFTLIDLHEYAKHIRYTTTKNTGIPVSVGLGPTKTLAKVANHFAKKHTENDGVYLIENDKKRIHSLKELPIDEVWGIGKQYAKLLKKYGIHTAHDFTQQPENWIRKNMTVVGVRTYKELHGKSCHEIETTASSKKDICTARSFGEMQTDFTVIDEAVSNFASRCASKLRKQKSVCNLILVFIHTNEHRHDLNQYASNRVINLSIPTNSTIEIVHYARTALKSIFREGFMYKKAGVIVSGISTEKSIQLGLFDKIDRNSHEKIMSSIDNLNNKFGKDKIKLAVQGNKEKWKLRQEKLSPKYTTDWNDIITVKS